MLTRRELFAAALPVLRLANQWQEAQPETARINIQGSTLEVQIAAGDLDISREHLLRWITKAGNAVAAYYDRFPVEIAQITVHPVKNKEGVFHGTTWGTDPPSTRIFIGQHTTQEQLDSDWMMTHELVHMAFPDVPRDQHWLEEGIATYVEPIARTLTGDLTPASIWHDMLASMPQGEPGPHDLGLNHTRTWASTYWGGALFCLLADVNLRRATSNQHGLRDALKAILRAGGSINHSWTVTQAFAIADRSTNSQVLTTMYSEMGEKPVTVDLDDLWKKLGVAKQGSVITFDDSAPLAAIRHSITPSDK